ncbi:Single-stranded DNA binding protein Ssb [Labeo rohita]|uniref:Single-stranded DNA binding protein Ssb n=1 Tax=Labeo rohita TaxID=84645 RepID=A0ABQ8L2T8_LABRO|nr:Single-stranded DNA binding protein Ssb [Labeo rohita]
MRWCMEVNVTVKVLDLIEDHQGFTRSHQKMKRRAYDVADKTGSVSLSVWGGEMLQTGKWYAGTNVSVRLFSGEISLSTTAESTFTMSAVDYGVAAVLQRYTVFEVVAVLLARITVEDVEGRMTDFVIDEFVLHQLLKIDCEGFFDTDVLVTKLLVEERIEMRCRGNRVMAAVFLSQCSDSVTEVGQTAGSVQTGSCSSRQESTEVPDDVMLEEILHVQVVQSSVQWIV